MSAHPGMRAGRGGAGGRPAGRALALLASILVSGVWSLTTGGAAVGALSVLPKGEKSRSLPTRMVQAGAVTVKVVPRRLDDRRAVFTVTLDTHSVDLDVDLRRQVTLTVGGQPWPGAGYTGDGPGGHHLEGRARFRAAGPAQGKARLTIGGLPRRVAVNWTIPD